VPPPQTVAPRNYGDAALVGGLVMVSVDDLLEHDAREAAS